MAKEISGILKLQIKGGQANPAPPVGTALGQRGVNIMEFCKSFKPTLFVPFRRTQKFHHNEARAVIIQGQTADSREQNSRK